MMALSIVALLLALVPCGLFVLNGRELRQLPARGAAGGAVSVLVPARNEEKNIAAALQSLLQSEGVEFEALVLDDHSTDRTAELVGGFAKRDARVRLLAGESLPSGWSGKNFACHQLAKNARHSTMLFMDADVRVSQPDSLGRLVRFLESTGAGLVSGIPKQETGTWLERLIIPLIHFVLLGFLPLKRMRTSSDPRFAAACGQLVAVRREAYERSGGHRGIAGRVHDGVALARQFRETGIGTDLFDATDTFQCRMYGNAGEVWHGFAKNAHEGIGSPVLIVPSTLILLGGQVLPMVLLLARPGRLTVVIATVAAVCALGPRYLAMKRFEQPRWAWLLHPVSIALLVGLQWQAAFSRALGRRAVWKGRPIDP